MYDVPTSLHVISRSCKHYVVFVGLIQQWVPAGRVAEAESRFSTSFLTAKGRYCNQDFLKNSHSLSPPGDYTLLAALRIGTHHMGVKSKRIAQIRIAVAKMEKL